MINCHEINYVTNQEMELENNQIDRLWQIMKTATDIPEERPGKENSIEEERNHECLHGELPEGDDSGEHEGDEPGQGHGEEEEAREGELGVHRDLPLADRFTLKRILQRAHEGLGHPSQERFLRILRYAKAKPEVLAEARNLRCSVCQRHQQTRPARRSAPPRELDVNDCLGVDVIYLPIPGNKTRVEYDRLGGPSFNSWSQ